MIVKLAENGAMPFTLEESDLTLIEKNPANERVYDDLYAELSEYLRSYIGQYSMVLSDYITSNYSIASVARTAIGRIRSIIMTAQSFLRAAVADGAPVVGIKYTNNKELPFRDRFTEIEPEYFYGERSDKVTDFKALLSTRQMLKCINIAYYTGLEFKFESNRHPSPAKAYIATLAQTYVMQVLIPNALIAKQYKKQIDTEAVKKALDYCMTTGKSQKSVEYWTEFVQTDRDSYIEVLQKFWFYVYDIKRDGTQVEASHRCYLDKYIDKKTDGANSVYSGERKAFRKSKNQDEVQKLVERMANEPELKTASHRRLMELGITNRIARQFMKARTMK